MALLMKLLSKKASIAVCQFFFSGIFSFDLCVDLDMAAGPWTFKVCSMDQETVCSNILHISVEGKYFGI